MSEEEETLYVSAQVPNTSCHITLAFRALCKGDDRNKLILDTAQVLGPIMPFTCSINRSDMIKVGKQGELDAYQVNVVDRVKRIALAKFWDEQQRRKEGHQMFPFNLHITLNKEQKRVDMEKFMGSGDATTFDVKRVAIKVLETKKIVVTLDSTLSQ